MKKKFHIVGGDRYGETKMFLERGYSPVDAMAAKSDNSVLILFTGGADLSPHLYGEENVSSYTNEARDNFEIETFREFLKAGNPMAGICRGAQLLCVMDGGKMIQHIGGHGSTSHDIFEPGTTNKLGRTNSCHHQQMVPCDTTVVVAETSDGTPEVVLFPKLNAIGVQGHPEWDSTHTEPLFFKLIDEHCNFNEKKAA